MAPVFGEASVEPPLVKVPNRINATRHGAREMIESRPDVSPTGAVYIDLKGALAVAAPFVNEVLDAWPYAQPVRADADVAGSWQLVVDHRAGSR
jgi:hypothetical protein